MNILQVSKVKVVDTPIVDTRLVLHWTPSSTTCSTSHWLPQSVPQLPLVTFETLCWNRKHVLSNLGSLTSVYNHFYRCLKKVVVIFGCGYLTAWFVCLKLLFCSLVRKALKEHGGEGITRSPFALTLKISWPFWWILGLKYVLIDMWANDQNEMMFFYLQL
jgi:hypothetical protein